MMRDHVTGRDLVNLEAERAATYFVEGCADSLFVFAHSLSVGKAGRLRVVLSPAKTAIVPAHEDLHLFAATPLAPENLQVGVAGDVVNRGVELLIVAH